MLINFRNWYIDEVLDDKGEMTDLVVKFKTPEGKRIVQNVDLIHTKSGIVDWGLSYDNAYMLRDQLVHKYWGIEKLQGVRKGYSLEGKYPSSGVAGISLSRKNGKKTYLYLNVRKFDGKVKSFNLLGGKTEEVFEEALEFYAKDRKIKGKAKKLLKINPFFGIHVRRELIEIVKQNRNNAKPEA